MEQTIDVKLQSFVGNVNPIKADFRKSQNQFVGAPQDNHQTIYEVRATGEDLEALGLTVADAVKMCETFNKLASLKSNTPDNVKKLAESLLASFGQSVPAGLLDSIHAGIAIRVYDKD